jgi:methylmalonyl-CoA/ethylmalonyl-CoA epimerase
MPADTAEDVASQQVRVQFIGTGHVRVELIEPMSDASPLAKSLGSRGPGLHHVALRVEDLDGRLAELVARGVRLIDRSARPGAHGTRVAFIHPSATGGVLIELVEHPKDVRAAR